SAQQAGGKLWQRVILAGRPDLPDRSDAALQVRYAKLHLHEARLPDYDETCRMVVASHDHGRPVAIHCVTLAELVFALGVVADAGVLPGDRIEHAGIAADEQVAAIAALGLIVVTQPNFIAERGDAYRADVEPAEQPWLYRGAAFLKAGVALAAGSDAPFGHPDPWAAMAAAVTRQSAAGHTIGPAERLTPEQALMLYLGQGDAPQQARRIAVGAPADLCLLDRDWSAARTDLERGLVKLTVRSGETLFTRPSASRSPP
ncbi:MAG TPA: amidohydrolase family protein, partial [Novosphingobium sp.]|nr:amidohydrolase family protein [Novosphingobium sp.]